MKENCTLYNLTESIGKKWTLLILFELYKGGNTLRYSEIKNNIPKITSKLLSLRLKELVSEKFVTKKIDASSFPARCDYQLTERGKEFIKIIKDMKKWALKWKLGSKFCEQTDCKKCTL